MISDFPVFRFFSDVFLDFWEVFRGFLAPGAVLRARSRRELPDSATGTSGDLNHRELCSFVVRKFFVFFALGGKKQKRQKHA